ncbi:SCND3 protein, partial [Polyodon spathula]|nr:SCND3 protein [Polyodon spathula]
MTLSTSAVHGAENVSDKIEKERTEPPSKKQKLRKYDDSFIKLGFMCVYAGGDSRPQCVVYGEVLSNEALKPAKLTRHLRTLHVKSVAKPVEYFERKSNCLLKQKKTIQTVTTIQKKALKVSYKVTILIAKNRKQHTIAETLLMPAAIDMCHEMLGDEAANKLKNVPVSNDTIKRPITDVAADVKDQLLDKIRASGKYSIQLDESLDVSSEAQLLVYVRYMDNFCIICTDGAAFLTGKVKGFVRNVSKQNSEILASHCILHREALVAKTLPPVNAILDQTVKIINYIKS